MLKTPETFGPDAYHLADWRRRVNDLYAQVRATGDPRAAHVHWHATRSALFRNHPMSPIPAAARALFTDIAVFPYDPALRFAVVLEPAAGAVIDYALGTDGEMKSRPIARTNGLRAALGAELTLYWIVGYGGGLFLPFSDATTGTESYGGGRYLIDAIKGADLGLDADGRLILDFNFAYNPSCALNDAYTCPLSPPGNHLPVPVRAGERAP